MRVWTSDEIEKIRVDFANGKRIKVIASELGRSLTAVNKLLSRAGIRGKGQPRKGCAVPVKRNRPPSRVLEIFDEYKPKDFSKFVEVILYLKKRGYDIDRTYSLSMVHCEKGGHLLNGRPVSRTKLLLLANRLRSEEGQPVFKIADIMFGECEQ
jgi:hypothetical protein